MDNNINNFITPFSLSIGFIVSMVFMEIFCLFGGGLIVPGYIALKLNDPISMGLTIVVSLLTYFSVKGIGKITLLFGRRKYMILLFMAFIIGGSLNYVMSFFVDQGFNLQLSHLGENEVFGVVGLVIPGLIAYWFDRQGILVTCSTLLCTAGIVRLCLIVILGDV